MANPTEAIEAVDQSESDQPVLSTSPPRRRRSPLYRLLVGVEFFLGVLWGAPFRDRTAKLRAPAPLPSRPSRPRVAISRAEEVRLRFEALPEDLGFEPCFAVFNGPPGTRKSLTVDALGHTFKRHGYAVATRIMVDEYCDDLVNAHKRHQQSNGYGSHIFFLDELFLTPNYCDADGKFIIANCTSTAAAPIVAEPKNKGTRVRPCIWMATSNNYNTATPKVSMGAIRRRVTLLFDVPEAGRIVIDGVDVGIEDVCELLLGEVLRRVVFLEELHNIEKPPNVRLPPPPVSTVVATLEGEDAVDYTGLPKIQAAKMYSNGELKKPGHAFVLNVVGVTMQIQNDFKQAGYRALKYGGNSFLVSNWDGFLKKNFPGDGTVLCHI